MSIETSATITAWVNEAFGPDGTDARRVSRANEEMAELVKAVASGDPPERLAEEAADVAIVLHLICGRLGFDLDEAIGRKMVKNRERKWAVDATGCGYHIKDGATRLQAARAEGYAAELQQTGRIA